MHRGTNVLTSNLFITIISNNVYVLSVYVARFKTIRWNLRNSNRFINHSFEFETFNILDVVVEIKMKNGKRIDSEMNFDIIQLMSQIDHFHFGRKNPFLIILKSLFWILNIKNLSFNWKSLPDHLMEPLESSTFWCCHAHYTDYYIPIVRWNVI